MMDLQIKLSGEVLEKLLSEGNCEVIVDYCSEKLLKLIETQVLNGLDLRGLYVSNVVLSKGIEEKIKTEVGNYLRCKDMEIRSIIRQEIEKQLPTTIKSIVQTALTKQKDKIIKSFEGNVANDN